jgi:hypothetical protein
MSWASIKRRYEAEGGLAGQSTEDRVARRILRALGLSEPRLAAAERGSGLAYDEDATLLERAVRIARTRSDSFGRMPEVMDAKSDKAVEKELADEYEERGTSEGAPAIAYRVGDEKEVRVMSCLGPCGSVQVCDLPLPCRLHVACGHVMATCEAETYFSKRLGKEIANG